MPYFGMNMTTELI